LIYPTERQIQEYMANLPAQVVRDFERPVADAQREYRRARLKNPDDPKALVEVLSRHAEAIFKSLVGKRLNSRSGTADEFRQVIGVDGGDAEMAMWFAHDLYRMSGDGRMPVVWQREIEPKLFALVRQAEDIWWLPEHVPDGWQGFLGSDPNTPAPPTGSLQQQETAGVPTAQLPEHERLARARRSVVEPLLAQKGFSVSQWALEARVDFHTANDYLEGTTRPRPGTRLELARALGIPVDQLPK
jgi:hypothetical protein